MSRRRICTFIQLFHLMTTDGKALWVCSLYRIDNIYFVNISTKYEAKFFCTKKLAHKKIYIKKYIDFAKILIFNFFPTDFENIFEFFSQILNFSQIHIRPVLITLEAIRDQIIPTELWRPWWKDFLYRKIFQNQS